MDTYRCLHRYIQIELNALHTHTAIGDPQYVFTYIHMLKVHILMYTHVLIDMNSGNAQCAAHSCVYECSKHACLYVFTRVTMYASIHMSMHVCRAC